MARKQRSRPEAGIEVVCTDEHYSAVLFSNPQSHENVIEIFSQPHHDRLFQVAAQGLIFMCKRCRQGHLLSWENYALQVQENTPPYQVLCVQGMVTMAVRPYETILGGIGLKKSSKLYTITGDILELIARVAPRITSNVEDAG